MDLQGHPEEYHLLILGSDGGSKLLAWTVAGQRKRVALVERKYVGGACPNIACLPSKNIIHTAQFAHDVQRGTEFGITVEGFHGNMPAVGFHWNFRIVSLNRSLRANRLAMDWA
jgi:pyruvate/2-oxoglutarate dehydrogenase complex dihydrolipoamide dehydrogenase (E3) component